VFCPNAAIICAVPSKSHLARFMSINVERYLDDLQDNVDKLKERFSPDYTASAEATTVLRDASDISASSRPRPANFDGASEWNRLSASLGDLAAAYGTSRCRFRMDSRRDG